jgi:hypothetical protein
MPVCEEPYHCDTVIVLLSQGGGGPACRGGRAGVLFQSSFTPKKNALFIGTQFSNLYTAVDTPAEAA